jgi:hypothetical protein
MKGTVIERQKPEVLLEIKDENCQYYPLECLLSGVEWPKNVDPKAREQYLTDEEFQSVFNMSKVILLHISILKILMFIN